jgi:pyruvate dehydrogenase E2 component (dihydrolipoamide acetyltransferase)
VMVVKVVASALKMFPKFNCSIDMETKEIIYKDFVNVGIAVNTPRGLLVPVLRDVDKKNMVEISAQVMEVAEKARTGRVSMDDLSGGTFTVTNLGSIGGTHFTPIINFPEVAILGMGRAFQMASIVEGGGPRMVLPLSLSYDHRIIDGAEGAAFLKWIVDAVEQPLLLSLEG